MIKKFQQAQHAIVLMLDANKTLSECFKAGKLIPYKIEWLRIEEGWTTLFGIYSDLAQTPLLKPLIET